MATPTNCLPIWHTKIVNIPKKAIVSGCKVNNVGNIACPPEQMRAQAEQYLRTNNYWPKDKILPLEVYTLGRYMTSEVGSGTPEERAAVGEAAINRAKIFKTTINGLLLYRQKKGHTNYGWYGPIHGPSGVSTAPYGRWAATSRDPNIADIVLASMIISGETNNFNNLADDQNGIEYFKDPAANVKKEAASGNYWVGPLPGVDHWHTFLYRKYGYKSTSPEGKALLERGLKAVADKTRPNWKGLPICGTSNTTPSIPTPTTPPTSTPPTPPSVPPASSTSPTFAIPSPVILGFSALGMIGLAIGLALGRANPYKIDI